MKVKAAQVTMAGEETRHGAPADEEGREKLAIWNGAMAPGGDERQTVMVGMRMDADGRELLTWALVKVAEPGDRVVALHVLPGSASAPRRTDSDGKTASCLSLISLIRSFDSVLAAYEGFCSLKQICRGSSLRKVLVTEVNNFSATKLVLGVSGNGRTIGSFDSVLAAYEGFCSLKQVRSSLSSDSACASRIDLKLKICRGSSLRKVLVTEVNNFSATKLVLGVSGNGRTIGSSTSVAKYCAKKVPRDCSVHAVDNGKIMFQKEGIRLQRPTELQKAGCCSPRPSFHAHHVSTKNSKASIGIDDANSEPSPRGEAAKHDTSMGPSCDDADVPSICRGTDGGESPVASSKPVPEPAQVDNGSQGIQPKKGSSTAVVRARPSSLSIFAKDFGESRPGWPLLRKTFLHDKRTVSEKCRISVVQWAMRLPSRYSASSSVHPVRRPPRAVVDSPPSLHINAGAIVPLGNDASHPPDAIHHEESRKHPKELESLQLKYSSTCRFTLNIYAEKMVGKGGSSRVYKGCLPDGKEIAVKILQQSEDVSKEFALEVEIITTLHHKNIISLSGFCFEGDNFMLVYDFLSRGSLEDNLHGDVKGKPSFGWVERYKVAMGVAEALEYLHGAGIAQPVIHRDVKSSNILLSDDCEPQLSDFGLAQWASSTSSNMTCNDVAGTFGYLAPEYFMYGKVNEKIDVYAFGVVLLELLTGRKPINTECPKGLESLVMWAKPMLESGKMMQLLDPSLGDNADMDQVERITLAASLCIRRSPRSRPMMALVLKLLQGDEDVVKWAKLQTGAAEEFDGLDDESASPAAALHSHLSLALLDVEDDTLSESSTENIAEQIMSHGSLEDYLKGRWSRSSSFN
ncbi:hypothetical protein Taro_005145 [Colocasia esculenta]|uniref:Protein kinase domain-containing protein n=1 Tax=Colocasia esculenta TaxID=4460 RepID=A0A843TNW9_COLES|nr:hypothetical protein [Colocasia esculenta]